MRINSLFARLWILGIVMLLFVGGVLLYGTKLYGETAADRAYDQLLQGAALQISERIYFQNGQAQVEIPPSAFSLLGLAKDDHVFYHVLLDNGEGESISLLGHSDLESAGNIGEFHFTDAEYKGFAVRKISYMRAIVEEGISGKVQVIIAQTTEARDALASELTRRALIALVIFGVLIMGLLTLSTYWALRPLRRLEAELLAREPLDFTPIQTTVPNEMETFTLSMNRFLNRLKRRTDVMQRLIAESTHQLRTPIAALRAQAELPIDIHNPQDISENKARIIKQARALSRLTEQLLSQTMIHHRADTILGEYVDLRKVAIDAERALNATRLSPQNALILNLCEEPIMIVGDHFSLREAVKNLLSNALEYGQYPVEITVDRAGIRVCDRGNGFDESAPPHNHGIGLTIVRDVVEAHKGRLSFAQTSKGFCAIITFEAF